MSNGILLNRHFSAIRKFVRAGKTDQALERLERLQSMVMSTEKNIQRDRQRRDAPVKSPEQRYVIRSRVDSSRSKITFAPKTGRIEVKIGDMDTRYDAVAVDKFIRQLTVVNPESNLTLRGEIRYEDGKCHCTLRSGRKDYKLSLL